MQNNIVYEIDLFIDNLSDTIQAGEIMENIIEVKELIKNYGNVKAVKGITFNVEKGSFFAFLGENGAGKSTTINILCTVLEKTSGSVKVCGYDLDTDKEKIRERIGIVFQGSVLDDDLTVLQNLKYRASLYGYSKTETKTRIDDVVESLDLKELLNRPYGKLSGGQRRRVDIARSLINKPEILFLDEPTTGLDPQTRISVWKTIDKLRANGLTVFMTTHYMEETRLCDNVIILDEGTIKAEGSPLELKNKYASDHLIWYTENTEEYTNLVKSFGFSFKYLKDAYVIKINNSKDATPILSKYTDIIKEYEVIKGDMDDVFLTVTGKELD